MSDLSAAGAAGQVASVGSFAFDRAEPMFTPWGAAPADPQGEADVFGAALDLEAVRAEAFALGWDEGRRTMELEFAAERESLLKLAQSLDVLQPEPTNALALLLAETVDRLVRQVVGEVAIDPDRLTARAAAAAALIGEETEPGRLRVHPDDLALLGGAALPVPLVADPALERGAILLETGLGWIEDGPAVRLERLRAELDRMGAGR